MFLRTLKPKLEVIIPIFNESAVINHLCQRLKTVFDKEELKKNMIQSVIFTMVDDGSTDDTPQKIYAQIQTGFPGRLIILSRNFGHQNAITAGMKMSEGEVVAIMDADLQDPPEVIPLMLEKWRSGFDVVYAERIKRKESILKVFCYWIFYRILAFLADINIPLDSGDFCLIDRKVVDAMNALPEKLRFPRGLRSWVGFKQTGLKYERAKRKKGKSKYTFGRLYRLATDGIASSSIRVLQITQVFSFVFAIAALCISIVAADLLLIHPRTDNPYALWFILAYFLISASGFMVMFALYVMGAYIGRAYLEIKGRPTFIIKEIITRDTIA